ncbi:MAG: ATP synthase F1 subunit delta [Deltaproteobacteria bacterium]|nr:ATP synthase F1 subunit delta [Deltaproteobacteria bacterium]
MIRLTVARKYARAFLEIGLQEGNYDTLGKELETIAKLLKQNRELRAVLFSAAYPAATRKGIVRAVVEPLGLSPSTVNFIDLLIDRERIDHFIEVAKSYESLGDAVAKRVRATLVTAGDISPTLVKTIKGQLESSTGKEVILAVEEDRSLIGGVMAKIGNVVYDGSLRMQFLKVKENLYKE